MLLLTSTAHSLELVTSTAETIDFVTSFVDITTTTLAPGSSDGTVAAATTTTLVAAPAASTQRQIKHLSVRNAGGAANVVTVQKDVGANRSIFVVTLAAGEELQYIDGDGFRVFDAAGNMKITSGGGGGSGSVPTGTGFRHVTAGVEDGAAKLIDTADINDDQVTLAKVQDINSDRLLGRDTAAIGVIEMLTVGGGIEFTGAGGIQTSAFTGDVTKAAGGTALTIPADAVTNAMLANMAANSIKLNNTGAAANPIDGTVAQALTLLGAFSSVAIQTFTASGTYTPAANMKFCIVISTGGGGGGGGADTDGTSGSVGAGGGGGAGGTCVELFSAATIGANQTVTVGAAGTAGSTAGGNGGTGGNTTFGALHTATGGGAGIGSGTSVNDFTASAGGAGGVPTGGLLNIAGGEGGSSIGGGIDGTTDLSFALGGNGGASFWGGGGRGGAVANASVVTDGTLAGNGGTAFGSGGGGGGNTNNTAGVGGGAGAAGVCMVIEFV
jgi:hypothetical protein